MFSRPHSAWRSFVQAGLVDAQHPAPRSCRVPGLRQGDFSGREIKIGHIDTGYGAHPEIEAGSCIPRDGFDFILKRAGGWEPANSGARSHGHGDSTASVIISRTPHNMRGVATGAVTVPYRAIEYVAVFTGMGRVVKAIRMAAESGTPVISMSLGGISAFSGLEKQLRKAEADGAICIAAAGNCVGFAVAPPFRTTALVSAAQPRMTRHGRMPRAARTENSTSPLRPNGCRRQATKLPVQTDCPNMARALPTQRQ